MVDLHSSATNLPRQVAKAGGLDVRTGVGAAVTESGKRLQLFFKLEQGKEDMLVLLLMCWLLKVCC